MRSARVVARAERARRLWHLPTSLTTTNTPWSGEERREEGYAGPIMKDYGLGWPLGYAIFLPSHFTPWVWTHLCLS